MFYELMSREDLVDETRRLIKILKELDKGIEENYVPPDLLIRLRKEVVKLEKE